MSSRRHYSTIQINRIPNPSFNCSHPLKTVALYHASVYEPQALLGALLKDLAGNAGGEPIANDAS